MMSINGRIEQAEELAQRITPLLSGQEPAVISVVLADLSATLIAGHHPQLRDEVLDMHIGLIRKLLPIAIAQIPDDAFDEEEGLAS